MSKQLIKPQSTAIAWLAASILALSLSNCTSSSEEGGTATETVVVTDAQSFSDAITIEGSQKISEEITRPNAPTAGFLQMASEIAITAGGTSSLSITPSVEAGSFIQAYLIQLDGARDTFVVPVGSTGQPFIVNTKPSAATVDKKISGEPVSFAPSTRAISFLSLAGIAGLELATETTQGNVATFAANATIQAFVSTTEPTASSTFTATDFANTDASQWTDPASVSFKAVDVGSGNIQITLTWDTTADVDLYLVEPDGNEISYFNENSISGDGFLDVDDRDGFGPENIFFDSATPRGDYEVKVDHYEGTVPTNYSVTVQVNGTSETFTGVLNTSGQTDSITTFTIN